MKVDMPLNKETKPRIKSFNIKTFPLDPISISTKFGSLNCLVIYRGQTKSTKLLIDLILYEQSDQQ